MKVRSRVVTAGTAIAFAGFLSSTPGWADTAAGGWQRLPHSQALPGSAVQVVQGRHAAGTCVFSTAVHLDRGQRSARMDEVAYDPIGCRAKFAVKVSSGVLPRAKAPKGQSVSGSSASRPTSARTGAGTVSPLASSSGYFHSETWDPVGLEINMVEDGGTWSHGSCVTGGTGYYNYWWLSDDGWQLSSSNFSNGYSCSRQDVSSYAHYYNFPFCGGTNTFFNRNHFYGYANGKADGAVSWSASGCLGNQLSVHYYAYQTS